MNQVSLINILETLLYLYGGSYMCYTKWRIWLYAMVIHHIPSAFHLGFSSLYNSS